MRVKLTHEGNRLRIFQVDAFTAKRFCGNPASVIIDADGQTDATMMAIAREFPQAETAFVSSATAADHDVNLRFFNARKEAPFVGHATIAAHHVLLTLGRRAVGLCRQRSGTGIIEVNAHIKQRDSTAENVIEFRQSVPELDAPLPFKTTLRIAEALKIPATHLHDVMPARIARKGSTRLLVPIADSETLDHIVPNYDTLLALGAEIGADGFFVFATLRDGEHLSTQSRMFCPALGIPEDPVSGNAHAMLAAYLWDLDQLPKKSSNFIGRQGKQMKRPGKVHVRLEVEQAELRAVHIAGTAVIVSEGRLAL
jgi:PhzF family phenazine biosynthesis protein